MLTKQLLIIGAGPYGLAAAAYAKHLGIDFALLGRPMEFWRFRMPKGLLLRSGSIGQVDPLGINTLERYLECKGFKSAYVFPLPVGVFVEYADWFMESTGITPHPSYIRQLEYRGGRFEAFTENGETLTAENVVAAPGLDFFRHLPTDLDGIIPERRYTHSCAISSFEPLAGRRCLVIGGRQSAFEWTALMVEAGVAQVHVAYRHATPQFAPSDWHWVDPLLQKTLEIKGWFRHLPMPERKAIEKRFWKESRTKLEPWLAPRISKENVKLWPHTSVESCKVLADGALHVHLSGGYQIDVDHIILAIGYRVDVKRVPYFSKTTILPRLKSESGYPALDEHFQTSVPGLYLAGLAATLDFGPFYGLVRGCPSAARIIGDHIQSRFWPAP